MGMPSENVKMYKKRASIHLEDLYGCSVNIYATEVLLSASKLSSSWCSQAGFAPPHHTLSFCSWRQWQQPHPCFRYFTPQFPTTRMEKKNTAKSCCVHAFYCPFLSTWSVMLLGFSSPLRLLITVNAVNNSRRTEATGHSECCQQFQN